MKKIKTCKSTDAYQQNNLNLVITRIPFMVVIIVKNALEILREGRCCIYFVSRNNSINLNLIIKYGRVLQCNTSSNKCDFLILISYIVYHFTWRCHDIVQLISFLKKIKPEYWDACWWFSSLSTFCPYLVIPPLRSTICRFLLTFCEIFVEYTCDKRLSIHKLIF